MPISFMILHRFGQKCIFQLIPSYDDKNLIDGHQDIVDQRFYHLILPSTSLGMLYFINL